jgi:hypothetical protein
VEISSPSEELLAQIDELRRRLSGAPDFARLHHDLLIAYGHPCFHGHPERIEQILWHLTHQPDSAIAKSPLASVNADSFPEQHAQVMQAWEAQLASDSARTGVLRVAAGFVFGTGPERARAMLPSAMDAPS